MTFSYKHIRQEYSNVEDNLLINLVQYSRRLLRANAANLPSSVSFSSFSSHSNFNKITFKSRYMANIIGSFIYSVILFQRVSAHLLKIIKRIVKIRKFKKSIDIKTYNRKSELIFFKKIKHIVLFFKWKCKKRIRKKRYLLWKSFYQIPSSFWSISKKKRIKSFIWRLFNRSGKYSNINKKKKYNLFFLSYNRISNIVYKILSRKRFSRKKWFMIKEKNKKTNKIFNKNVSRLWLRRYTDNIISNKLINTEMPIINMRYRITVSDLYSTFINNFKIVSNIFNVINFPSFFLNYCYFHYFRLLNNKYKYDRSDLNISKLFYFFLSSICKNRNKMDLIRISILKKPIRFSIVSHNSFFIRLNGWFSNFYLDRDLNMYFIVNRFLFRIYPNSTYNYIHFSFKYSFFIFFYIKQNKKNLNDTSYINFQIKIFNKKASKLIILVNNNIIPHIRYFQNIHRSKSWTRSCFYPYVSNRIKSIKLDLKNHPSNKILKIKQIFSYKKLFFLDIVKNIIKNNVLNNSLSINKIGKTKNNYSNYYINRKNKFYNFKTKKRFSKLRHIGIKKKIKYFNNNHILFGNIKEHDQFLLNYYLYSFINKVSKKLYKFNNIKKKIKPLIFNRVKHRKKFNYVFFHNKYVFSKNVFILKKQYFNNWKYYKTYKNLNSDQSIDDKTSKNVLTNNIFVNKLKFLKTISKNRLCKLDKILFNLYISNSSYNYYLKNERYFFIEKLWNNRKWLNTLKKIDSDILSINIAPRFISKVKFVNKFYCLDIVSKELVLEYYLRLHSNNIFDEFERNFSGIGPLSFYHNKTYDVDNIKMGYNILLNLFFNSKFIYPQLLFIQTFDFLNVLIILLFLPSIKYHKIDSINQFLTVNKFNYIQYKKYILNRN